MIWQMIGSRKLGSTSRARYSASEVAQPSEVYSAAGTIDAAKRGAGRAVRLAPATEYTDQQLGRIASLCAHSRLFVHAAQARCAAVVGFTCHSWWSSHPFFTLAHLGSYSISCFT